MEIKLPVVASVNVEGVRARILAGFVDVATPHQRSPLLVPAAPDAEETGSSV